MATTLRRFSDAYASMVVAAYEPLILRWVSGLGLRTLAASLATRLPKAALVQLEPNTPPAHVLAQTFRTRLPTTLAGDLGPSAPDRSMTDFEGHPLNREFANRLQVEELPEAINIGGTIYPYGATRSVSRGRSGEHTEPPPTVRHIPAMVSNTLGHVSSAIDLAPVRRELFTSLTRAATRWAADPQGSLSAALKDASVMSGTRLPHLISEALIEEALSPIGIAHFYRQLYFHLEEGVGPIEEAFTIAPLETLEVAYETVRKQVHEEILEQGFESVSENAVEEKNTDEVSDKVSSMVQQDFSAAMTASTSGGIGVWSASASASVNFGQSSQQNREYTTKRLKDMTRRASERITKSFSIKTRDLQEVTATSRTRRVIRNDSPEPVSFGLRRVLRKVLVKVQDLGPRLVWQLYISDPGRNLLRSRFLHMLETTPVVTGDPPGTPPKPEEGTDTGTQQVAIGYTVISNALQPVITIVVQPGSLRDVTSLVINAVNDLEGGGKDDEAPAAKSQYGDVVYDEPAHSYSFTFRFHPGDSAVVSVSYTYSYKPSKTALEEWEAKRKEELEKATQELLIQQFDQQKSTITERSKIRPRPANDLRREERYEVMSRLVAHLFDRGDDLSTATPIEIEYFSRYFDVEGMFVYTHPAWWKPRNIVRLPGFPHPKYEVTAESEPAPLGSSLGWLLQLDGDRRRNEFLNSPWVRACMPIRPGRERAAIRWLAEQLEGAIGFDIDANPLRQLVEDVESRRDRENQLGQRGPDYVTVSSTPGAPADPLSPEGVYPIIDEFPVTVPTEGFVYDTLTVITD